MHGGSPSVPTEDSNPPTDLSGWPAKLSVATGNPGLRSEPANESVSIEGVNRATAMREPRVGARVSSDDD